MSDEKKERDEADESSIVKRLDEEAKGIVSNVDPETRKYFADLAKQLGIGDDKHE
jgi:hypothetical protein